MSLAYSRTLLRWMVVAWSVVVATPARGGNSEFTLGQGSTDGDVIREAEGRRGVRSVRSRDDRMSDASFATFLRWPNLYGVYLSNTAVTGGGFHKLRQHEHLIQVSLLGPNVNDDGIRTVSRLPHVTHLQIGNYYAIGADCSCKIHHAILTNEALGAVSNMKKLQYLTIVNADIDDEGIQQLAALQFVRNVQFFHCKRLTLSGIERLRAALPRATITAHVPDIATQQ